MRALHRLLARSATPAALAALALATVAFAACQESGFDERRETARPLKVQHFRGESKVPGQAEAPATLSVDALDNTLALELKPVLATPPGGEVPDYLRRRAAGVRLAPPVRAGDVIAVESADPDVIIDDEGGGVPLYEELITIAPTVITAGGGQQWKLNVRLVGEGLGRTNDAEALMNDYDRRVAEVRRAVGRGQTVALVEVRSARGQPRLRVTKPGPFARTVLADAGVKPARTVRDADGVLVIDPREPVGRDASADEISLPILGELRGRQAVGPVDAGAWRAPGGVLAARAILGDLERALGR